MSKAIKIAVRLTPLRLGLLGSVPFSCALTRETTNPFDSVPDQNHPFRLALVCLLVRLPWLICLSQYIKKRFVWVVP